MLFSVVPVVMWGELKLVMLKRSYVILRAVFFL
jgi:hypothetical protein